VPQEAIEQFDLAICGASYYGDNNWFVPSPRLSFNCQTELQSIIANKITLQYMANIHKQASRCLHEVTNEMRIHQLMLDNGHSSSGATKLLRRAVDRLKPGVFSSSHKCPIFPFTYPTPDVSLLRLQRDVKRHLIFMAVMDLFRQGYGGYLGKFNWTLGRLMEETAVKFHNMLIKHTVSRYEKYTKRGITIIGPDLVSWRQSGVLQEVGELRDASCGISIFVKPDYYYKMEYSKDDADETYDCEMFHAYDSDENVVSEWMPYSKLEEAEEVRCDLCFEAQVNVARWLDDNLSDSIGLTDAEIRDKYEMDRPGGGNGMIGDSE